MFEFHVHLATPGTVKEEASDAIQNSDEFDDFHEKLFPDDIAKRSKQAFHQGHAASPPRARPEIMVIYIMWSLSALHLHERTETGLCRRSAQFCQTQRLVVQTVSTSVLADYSRGTSLYI